MSEIQELKTIFTEYRGDWEKYKNTIETQRAEDLKKHNEVLGTTKEKLERFENAMQAHESRMEKLQLELGRSQLINSDPLNSPTSDVKIPGTPLGAFYSFCRNGKEKMSPEHLNTMVASDDSQGGIFAGVELVSGVVKGVIEQSPVRAYARVRTTGARSTRIRKRTGTFAAVWVGETGTKSETTGLAWAMDEVPNHEIYARVDVSVQDLEDAVFDLEGEFKTECIEQFALAEGNAFLNGDGNGKPKGIMQDSGIGYTASGTAATVGDNANALIRMWHSLKEPYTNGARWMMRRATLGEIRVLTDDAGQYIFHPTDLPGFPSNILSSPWSLAAHMPAIGENTYPVLFGNFKMGYYISDRVAMSTLRDPYSAAANSSVIFYFRKRVGGQVAISEAFTKLKCATS